MKGGALGLMGLQGQGHASSVRAVRIPVPTTRLHPRRPPRDASRLLEARGGGDLQHQVALVGGRGGGLRLGGRGRQGRT
eukprot:2036292-Pyramimonas_sp.AAC.1